MCESFQFSENSFQCSVYITLSCFGTSTFDVHDLSLYVGATATSRKGAKCRECTRRKCAECRGLYKYMHNDGEKEQGLSSFYSSSNVG